jgi:hypothetical protein
LLNPYPARLNPLRAGYFFAKILRKGVDKQATAHYNVIEQRIGKGLTMKYTNEYKKAAYKVAGVCDVSKMTDDELKAAKEYADELKFYADMSDDYSVTRAEKNAIYKHMQAAYEEMKKRGIF